MASPGIEDMKDRDDQETYDKPSRAKRKGGKQKRNKEKGELVPKEPYRRQRFNPVDYMEDDDLE